MSTEPTADEKPTGTQVADWVEANVDTLGPLEPWQRAVVEHGSAAFTLALPRRKA